MVNCSLCTDPEMDDNLIHTCQKCSVSVHALCYGIEDPGSKWLCSLCQKNISGSVKCALCHQKDGAFKPTTCGKWVHAVCALFTEGVYFKDNQKMEPVNIRQVPAINFGQKCAFCTHKYGACGNCSKDGCKNHIHVTCAQKKNCLEEITNVSDNLSLKFRAYCLQHKPKNSKRLSFGFVREIVDRKGRKETEQKRAKGLNMNARWLLNAAFAKQYALDPIMENEQRKKEKSDTKKKSANEKSTQKENRDPLCAVGPKKALDAKIPAAALKGKHTMIANDGELFVIYILNIIGLVVT